MTEIARLTALSRPTLYRMLSSARQGDELAVQARRLEKELVKGSKKLGHPALLVEFAAELGEEVQDLRAQLSAIFTRAAAELDAGGSAASTRLIDLLPDLPHVEKVILNMLIFQRLSLEEIADSVQRPLEDIVVWGALGLLRVLSVVRPLLANGRQGSGDRTSAASEALATA